MKVKWWTKNMQIVNFHVCYIWNFVHNIARSIMLNYNKFILLAGYFLPHNALKKLLWWLCSTSHHCAKLWIIDPSILFKSKLSVHKPKPKAEYMIGFSRRTYVICVHLINDIFDSGLITHTILHHSTFEFISCNESVRAKTANL